MKRNASRSSKLGSDKLTLVDRHGQQIQMSSQEDETSAEYQILASSGDLPSRLILDKIGQMHHGQIVAFAAVSIGCAAAAVATGSYALWLTRRKVVREALVSVNDLLETCRDRVSQMEEELNSSLSRS